MSEFEYLQVRKLADKSVGERIKLPVLQDTTLPNGEVVQSFAGWKLVDPNTPGTEHEPWPSAGVTVLDGATGDGGPPRSTTAGMRWVDQACREGWMRRIGEQVVARPAGPPDNPNLSSHVFIHADKLIIEDAVRGEVVYRVVRNPDKRNPHGDPIEAYEHEDDSTLASAGVEWFYTLKLENVNG